MSKKRKQHKTTMPGHFAAVNVVDQDLVYALKVFKRKMKETKVLETLKENRTYTKPSVTKRAQKSAARYIQHIRELNRD